MKFGVIEFEIGPTIDRYLCTKRMPSTLSKNDTMKHPYLYYFLIPMTIIFSPKEAKVDEMFFLQGPLTASAPKPGTNKDTRSHVLCVS
jgi:hypothetical protein